MLRYLRDVNVIFSVGISACNNSVGTVHEVMSENAELAKHAIPACSRVG